LAAFSNSEQLPEWGCNFLVSVGLCVFKGKLGVVGAGLEEAADVLYGVGSACLRYELELDLVWVSRVAFVAKPLYLRAAERALVQLELTTLFRTPILASEKIRQ
jgi:hypothetical protein